MQVVFRNTTVQGNAALGIRVRNMSNVTLEECLIADQTQGGTDSNGGGLVSGALALAPLALPALPADQRAKPRPPPPPQHPDCRARTQAVGDGSFLTIAGSNITGNNCTTGCGVNANGASGLNVTGSRFSGNNAFQQGGAMMLARTPQAIISDSNFDGNTALTDGGAIALDTTELWVERVSMSRNIANRSGGALHVYYANLTASQLAAVDNRAGRGGGVQCDSCELSLIALTDSR
jgi:predicted outer membrane repeat protein